MAYSHVFFCACCCCFFVFYKSVKYDDQGEWCPEKECLWWQWLTFRQPDCQNVSQFVKMSYCRNVSQSVFETPVNVTTNSPSRDYTFLDDHTLPTYDMTLWVQTINIICISFVLTSSMYDPQLQWQNQYYYFGFGFGFAQLRKATNFVGRNGVKVVLKNMKGSKDCTM